MPEKPYCSPVAAAHVQLQRLYEQTKAAPEGTVILCQVLNPLMRWTQAGFDVELGFSFATSEP